MIACLSPMDWYGSDRVKLLKYDGPGRSARARWQWVDLRPINAFGFRYPRITKAAYKLNVSSGSVIKFLRGKETDLSSFRFQVVAHWYWSLRRRSQTRRLTWEQMVRLANRWLPPPTLHHPYLLRRLGVIT